MTEGAVSPGGAAPARRVTVVADDVLPRKDEPARAAGLRAWAIGEGLRANGLAVRYAVRTHWWPAGRPLPPPRQIERYWSGPAELDQAIEAFDPEILVNCSYPSVLTRLAAERIVVQDVNGPRLLEGAFRDPASLERSAWREVTAYVAADYFVCGGERQLTFYYPWLALSGFDLTDSTRYGVVRIGLTGTPPARAAVAGRLLSAAACLPWTDPRRGWRVAVEEAEKAGGTMRLLFSDEGGEGRASFLAKDVARLREARGCEVRPAVPWGAFVVEMTAATAAVDVMERNSERELAVPTRTLAYLWAGLPPILSDFGDLGEIVARFDAGWVVPSFDEEAMRNAIREALGNADVVARKSANARRLHETLLRPEIGTRGLASICRAGTRRPGKRARPAAGLRRRLAQEAARLACRLAEGPRFGWVR
jgi:hypothetical protein